MVNARLQAKYQKNKVSMAEDSVKAKLVLEDGSFFEGLSFGASGEKMGEVILNTAVVGYQEIITDPANAGKIVVLTYPLIGNYGVAEQFNESRRCWIEGLVIKEPSRISSNWQAEGMLEKFLKKQKVVAAEDVDTRTLAVRLRDKGEMFGILSTSDKKVDILLKELEERKKKMKMDFIGKISTKKIVQIKGKASARKIAILDIGITNSILKQLKDLGCNITLLPYNTSADKILASNLDGLIISNGPEKDESIPGIVDLVKKLIGKIPILGISTGHEIISLALGGKLKKMKLGHRGVNYPVKTQGSYKGEITTQNHSLVVQEESIKMRNDIKITRRNVNDNSIEEMESGPLKFISIQYYPASPGCDEINEVFKRFLKITK